MRNKLMMADGDGGAGGGGAAPTAFYSESNKDFVAAKGWKAGDDVIQSYRNLETLVGADKAGRTVVLPKDDKDVDGIKAYRTKLGVPDAHTGYKIPEAMKADPQIGKFAELAHKLNIPSNAFGEVMGWIEKQVAEGSSAEEAAAAEAQTKAKAESETALNGLKAEWGDKFTENSEFARRFLKESGWDDERIGKYEAMFGTATMLKDFHAWGSKTGELKYEGGAGGGSGFSVTATQARTRLDEMTMQRSNGQINDMRWKELEPELEKLRIAASRAA